MTPERAELGFDELWCAACGHDVYKSDQEAWARCKCPCHWTCETRAKKLKMDLQSAHMWMPFPHDQPTELVCNRCGARQQLTT